MTLSSPQTSSPRRVLVIDDNEDSAELVAMIASMLGHQVQVAYRGADALAAARANAPDVVLLDISLPDMTGYEVARTLKQEGLHGQFMVAISGYGEAKDRQLAHEAGFDEHLTKPIDPAQVEEVLTRSRQQASKP